MPFAPLWRYFFRMLAGAAFCAVAGCSYKSEIRQGDNTLRDKIAALQIGMTRDEVRELLGANRTPEVFSGGEWVYYYRRRIPGFFPTIESGGVTLEFEDDILERIRPLAGTEAGAPE